MLREDVTLPGRNFREPRRELLTNAHPAPLSVKQKIIENHKAPPISGNMLTNHNDSLGGSVLDVRTTLVLYLNPSATRVNLPVAKFATGKFLGLAGFFLFFLLRVYFIFSVFLSFIFVFFFFLVYFFAIFGIFAFVG